jgi:glycogen(starch) synthase
MNIGLLSFEYPPETGFGGIGSYTWYHARALARMGHQVHVFAGATQPSSLATTQHDGVTVHRFRSGGLMMRAATQFGKARCYWTQQRVENAWNMYRAVKTVSRRHPFDVLEMPECGAEGSLLTSLLKTPAVVRFHSPSRLIMPFYDVPRADHVMCSAVEQQAIRRATALTSCSSFLADEVRTTMGVNRPITVIPNGIDLELFDREPVLDVAGKYGIPKNKLTILFAARMERRKGIHLCGTIAEKILRRHDVTMVFAGQDLFGYMSDTLLPSLQNQELRGSIHYVGKLDLKEIRSLARTADILMLPSLWENCPYSCLEAMAAGRAIVSSDQGGMPELIRDGYNGLLARCGEPESFAAQLEKVIESEELRRRLGGTARKSVEQCYTDDRVARLSTEVYEQCINRARNLANVPAPASMSS